MSVTPNEFMNVYEAATREQGLDAKLSLIDEEAIFFFSNQSVHVGKQAVERAIRHNFEVIKDDTYSISNLTWLVQSNDVAACVYDFAWSGTVHGEPASGSGRGTTILKRVDNQWRVLHEHLSQGKFARSSG